MDNVTVFVEKDLKVNTVKLTRMSASLFPARIMVTVKMGSTVSGVFADPGFLDLCVKLKLMSVPLNLAKIMEPVWI